MQPLKKIAREIDQSSFNLSAIKNHIIPNISGQRIDDMLNKVANILEQYSANDTESTIANVPKSVTPMSVDKITQMNSSVKQNSAAVSASYGRTPNFNTGKNVNTPPKAPPLSNDAQYYNN